MGGGTWNGDCMGTFPGPGYSDTVQAGPGSVGAGGEDFLPEVVTPLVSPSFLSLKPLSSLFHCLASLQAWSQFCLQKLLVLPLGHRALCVQ